MKYATRSFPAGAFIIALLVMLTTAWAANSAPKAVQPFSSEASAQSHFKVLYEFDRNGYSEAPVIFDAAGNLYGVTAGNLRSTHGAIFVLKPNSDGTWTETTIYTFTGGRDGAYPLAGLLFDADGNLFGTTTEGGDFSYGTIFALRPNPDGSWTENTLLSFSGGADGASPEAGLTIDSAGNLYGTTVGGGVSINCCGVVFEMVRYPDWNWTYRVLHTFTDGTDGKQPQAVLVFDAAGNLYGTTSGGGTGTCAVSCGTIFQMTPNLDGSWTENVLYNFIGSRDGDSVRAGVIMDESGNLYGTSAFGGTYSRGTIFQLKPNSDGSWTLHPLHQFTNGKDGGNPLATLVFDAAGNLYGTTNDGGIYGCGVAFQLKPTTSGTWTLTALHQFSLGHDGCDPVAPLILDGAGNFYGTAIFGGKGAGVVFELLP